MAPRGRLRKHASSLATDAAPPPQSDPTTATPTLPDVTGALDPLIPEAIGSSVASSTSRTGRGKTRRILLERVTRSTSRKGRGKTKGGFIERATRSTSKKGRGKTRGILFERATRGGQRVPVTFPEGKYKPVGEWAKEFTSQVGVICRLWAPHMVLNWAHVPARDKEHIYQLILEKFDIDLDRPNVKVAIDEMLKSRYRNWRHRLYTHYKGFAPEEASQHPPEDMSQENWDRLCEHYSSERYQKKSRINTENRGKLRVNHTAGSKSFVRLRHDLQNPDTREEPSRIDFYRHSHYRSDMRSWVSPEAKQIYEQMTILQSQPMPDGVIPLTPDEICNRVLGTRPGFIRGLGYGERPNSSSASGQISQSRVEEMRQKYEDAERRADQLEMQVHDMRMEMDDMRANVRQMQAWMQSRMSQSQPSREILPD